MNNQLKFFDIVEKINNNLHIPVLSFPYSIFIELFDQDDIRPQNFRSRAISSPARFYTTLSALESAGQIVSQPDPHDRRAKLYRLSPATRQGLSQLHALLPDWVAKKEQSKPDPSTFMCAFSKKTREILKVPYLSPEYQIIVYLYDAGALTASELQCMSDASPSTFFKCLKQMAARNLIIATRDTQDKRIIRYRLTDEVQSFIHECNVQVRDWIQLTLASRVFPTYALPTHSLRPVSGNNDNGDGG